MEIKPKFKKEEALDGYTHSINVPEDLVFPFSTNSDELVKNIQHPLPKI